MKPDWDTLAEEFSGSTKVVIADVDCTGEGEPLCSRFGVEGFPTIKSFSPPDTEGEDYEGERDLDAMREFASSLGPGCSAVSKENCGAEELAALEKLMETPAAELEAELTTLKEQLDSASEAHDELLQKLQEQYEQSEEELNKLKKELGPRIKTLRAATAKPTGSPAKDEV